MDNGHFKRSLAAALALVIFGTYAVSGALAQADPPPSVPSVPAAGVQNLTNDATAGGGNQKVTTPVATDAGNQKVTTPAAADGGNQKVTTPVAADGANQKVPDSPTADVGRQTASVPTTAEAGGQNISVPAGDTRKLIELGSREQSVPARPVAAPKSVTSETVFPNGLRVVVLEDHSYPVVSCLTWYHVGARNEISGSTGVSHLLEHLLFGRVGTFRKGEIATTVARVGGQFNGYTSDDFTAFFETLPTGRLDLALKIESQRMRSASFSDADVQEEIANIQNEFENEQRDPYATLTREVRASLYEHHPYRHPPLGWRNDVEGLTPPTVKEYYDRYFRPDNCTLVISGDVATKQALLAVNKYFGPLQKSAVPLTPLKSVEPVQSGERRITLKYPGKQEMVEVAYHGPAFDDADAPAMVVLEKLLNANYAGRLKTKLLDAKVCSAANSSFEAKRDPGFFSIVCTVPPGVPSAQQRLGEAIDGLVNQLKIQPVADAELRRAKNQAEFAFFTERQGPYRAGFHVGYFDSLSRWQNVFAWPDRLHAVTAADVQRVAKKYLNADNRVVASLVGTMAPKPPAPKPASDGTTSPKSPSSRQIERKLTGYKADDDALAPRGKSASYVVAQALADLAIERDKALLPKPSTTESIGPGAADSSIGESDIGASLKGGVSTQAKKKTPGATAVQQAIKDIPSALPNAVKDLPAVIGGAPKAVRELPAAVEAVPAVIKNIPNAIQEIPSAIKQIPSAIGSIPSAVKELPSAIGGIPGAAVSAVKVLPGAIGGLPGTAATTVKELPAAIGGIPGAAASAIKTMPAAIGNLAIGLGGIPGAIGKQLGAVSAPHEQSLRTTQRVLKNGVKLIVFETHVSPIVQVYGAVRAGSVYEPPGKKGLSALTAATFNQGTARKGRLQVLTQQEDMGLSPSAMLHFDHDAETIEFRSRALSRDLQPQLELIAETLSTPALSDADIDHAKQDVLTAIKQADDTAEEKANRILLRNLLANGSSFCPDDPNELSRGIPSLTAADERKFLNSYVAPGATTIVVAGDVDPDRAADVAERVFGAWEGKGLHQRVHAHPNPKRVLRASVPLKQANKATITFGQLVPMSKQGPEFGSLLIADSVFSTHPLFSRLNKRLNSEPALAHALGDETVETHIEPLSNAVEWSFCVSVEPNAVPVAVQSLQTELKQLGRTGVTPVEFHEVKRYLLGAIPVRSMSTLGTAAHSLLEMTIHGDETEGTWSTIGSVRSANIDSVNRVIKTALRPDQTTMVVIGSPQAIRAARNQVATQSIEHEAQPPQDAASQPSAQTSENIAGSAVKN